MISFLLVALNTTLESPIFIIKSVKILTTRTECAQNSANDLRIDDRKSLKTNKFYSPQKFPEEKKFTG